MASNSFYKDLANKVYKLLSSNIFFNCVLVLSILQGLWYALSFKLSIFDENIHIGFINYYAHHLSPFISHQPVSLDSLGEVTRNPSYLYYYLMSWPLRLIDLFSHSNTFKIIWLRLINVAIFTFGLVLYRKVFMKIGAPKALANLVLLFVILTPAIAILPGAVNYDNAVFTLSALTLLYALIIIKDRKIAVSQIVIFLSVGLLACEIKFEFLAFFAPVAIYLFYCLWTKHKSQTFKNIKTSYQSLTLVKQLSLVALLLISLTLFIERPVWNIVKYHSVNPSCTRFISQTRCQKNYTENRNIIAKAQKPANFSPQNPYNYLLEQWIPGMITTQTIIPPAQMSSPLLRILYYTTALGGLLIIVFYLREFLRTLENKFLLLVMTLYVLVLATYNYSAYITYGQPLAITGRYLLPVLPIFIFFVGLSIVKSMSKHKNYLVFSSIVLILLFTQGGGILTYLIGDSQALYWSNGGLTKLNVYTKDHLKQLVKLSNVH